MVISKGTMHVFSWKGIFGTATIMESNDSRRSETTSEKNNPDIIRGDGRAGDPLTAEGCRDDYRSMEGATCSPVRQLQPPRRR